MSTELCGMYEYSIRNFYTTFFKKKSGISEKERKELNRIYNNRIANNENKYTGLLKGKNIILLQMEGLDNWLLTEKDTPTLYKLKKKSIDFVNHFSMYTGGGSTFNSELAVNTGFVQPLSAAEPSYNYYKNTYKNTLSKLFKKEGYESNAFHMNTEKFYLRGLNYENWGYKKYYGLNDKNLETKKGQLDRELITNKEFSKILFPKNKKFIDYIITYTPHMPFDQSDVRFQIIIKEKYGKTNRKFSEEEIARLAAGETDYMVKLLIEKLKQNKLYNNTVIIAYADHYLYTLADKSILDKYKTTNNALINHTPMFIWSSDIKPEEIKKVTMQTNVLPTVLNLFGIKYNVNDYVGEDALDKNYKGVAFFDDFSWYDGNVYFGNNHATQIGKSKIDNNSVDKTNQKVQKMIRKNDLSVKGNYFGN